MPTMGQVPLCENKKETRMRLIRKRKDEMVDDEISKEKKRFSARKSATREEQSVRDEKKQETARGEERKWFRTKR